MTAHKITKKDRQNLFVVTLAAVAGNITKACEIVGVSRQAYYNWMEDSDSDFSERVADLQFEAYERRIDLAEEKMDERVRVGSGPDVRFILKTLGAKRGYGAKSTVTVDRGEGFKDMEWPDETPDLDEWEEKRDKEMVVNKTQSQEDDDSVRQDNSEGEGPDRRG